MSVKATTTVSISPVATAPFKLLERQHDERSYSVAPAESARIELASIVDMS